MIPITGMQHLKDIHCSERKRKNRKGDGVAPYVKNAYSCIEVQEEEIGGTIDSMWININGVKTKGM